MSTLLSIDIWDTLLRRRCHPDEVKLWTAVVARRRLGIEAPALELVALRQRVEAEIGARRQQQGFDDEYELCEVLEAWLGRAVDPSLPREQIRPLAHELADVEEAQERAVVYVDDLATELARASGASRIVAISDFYMGADRLTRILESARPSIVESGVRLRGVFASCEPMVSKRGGRLFEYVRSQTATRKGEHAHIGDHPWSDVENARRFGCTATRFENPPQDALRSAHNERFAVRCADFGPTFAHLERRLSGPAEPSTAMDPQRRRLWECGRRFAPVAAGMVLLACEQAIARRVAVVHYFTREGELLAAMHRRLAGAHGGAGPMGVPMPAAEVLQVSRIATFFASMREFTCKELMRVWNQYSSQSMGQLLSTLGLDPFPVEPLLARHGLTLDEGIRFPWQDPRVRALLDDRLFVRWLEQEQHDRRPLLERYLRERGLPAVQRDAVIVDIGWRGTIQDNLAHLLPRTTITGVYLGLQHMLNEQPGNVRKIALGPDARRSNAHEMDVIRCVAPFEMLLNSPGGSVRGYELAMSDGGAEAVRAVTTEDEGESAVHRRYVSAFQQGVLDAAGDIADFLRTFAVEAHELRGPCLEILRRTAHEPAPEITRAFFSLTHNETFGVGGFVDKRFVLAPGMLAAARRSEEGWRQFVDFLERTSWPQGFLRLHGLDDLKARYDAQHSSAVASGTIAAPSGRLGVGERSMIEAKARLAEIEASVTWRLVRAMKRVGPFSWYARWRHGPAWHVEPPNETPIDRLRRVEGSRTFRVLTKAKGTGLYRTYRRLRKGDAR